MALLVSDMIIEQKNNDLVRLISMDAHVARIADIWETGRQIGRCGEWGSRVVERMRRLAAIAAARRRVRQQGARPGREWNGWLMACGRGRRTRRGLVASAERRGRGGGSGGKRCTLVDERIHNALQRIRVSVHCFRIGRARRRLFKLRLIVRGVDGVRLVERYDGDRTGVGCAHRKRGQRSL